MKVKGNILRFDEPDRLGNSYTQGCFDHPIKIEVVDGSLYVVGELDAVDTKVGEVSFVSSSGYGEVKEVVKNKFWRQVFRFWLFRKLLWFIYRRVVRIRIVEGLKINSINLTL
jgi:hypothetical protein